MHLASPASPADFERIPIQILKVGGLGTHNCLGLAKAKGARFFLASTSEVYGDPLVHPQPETYWGNVNPIGPRGVYDEAKRFAEAMTMAYHRHHGLDVRIVRIFNTYGPRMQPDDGRAVSNFLVQALRGEPLTSTATASRPARSATSTTRSAGFLALLDCRHHRRRSTSATRTSSRSASSPSWRSRSPARRPSSRSSRCRSTTRRSASPTSRWPASSLGWEPSRAPRGPRTHRRVLPSASSTAERRRRIGRRRVPAASIVDRSSRGGDVHEVRSPLQGTSCRSRCRPATSVAAGRSARASSSR